MEKQIIKQNKKHGVILITLMVINCISAGVAISSTVRAIISNGFFGEIPYWLFIYSLVATILTLTYTYGVFKWKKWAIYVLLASGVLAILTELLIIPSLKPLQLTSFLYLILIYTLWLWAIYRKWKDFE